MKLDELKEKFSEVESYLSGELAKIRTGRASASLVEDIKVLAYEGSDPLPLKELGVVAVTDPQTITISPWDKSILGEIELAIKNSEKGLNPVNDGSTIRVSVPKTTEETRKEQAKQISGQVEKAKIRVRTIRQNAIKAAEEMEENGVISEDELFSQKKQIDEEVSKINKTLEDMGKAKNEELMKV